MTDRLDRIESRLGTVEDFVAAHSAAIARLDERLYTLAEAQARNSAEITGLRGIVESSAAQLRLSVEQAERDRVEFRAEMREMRTEIRDILSRLEERFNGNGHSD